MRHHLAATAMALATLALAGCIVVPAGPPPVPVARSERVPPAPTSRMVWQPGEWRWQAGTYVWEPGHYVERLAAFHRWVPAHWNTQGAWVPGHWV